MKVSFGQSSQECGSVAVCLYAGSNKLAEVGIGESVDVELPVGKYDLVIRCGTLSYNVQVDTSQELEVP